MRLIKLIIVVALIALAVNRCYPVINRGHHGQARSAVCNIKGNISQNGDRIYHVPGQKWYSRTRIDISSGERWFCTEEEARAAGWRRSYE